MKAANLKNQKNIQQQTIAENVPETKNEIPEKEGCAENASDKNSQDSKEGKVETINPENIGESLGDLGSRINTIIDQIAELSQSNKELSGRMAYKDEAIIRMQKRLEEYEKDLLKSIKEILIKDIILFYDSLAKFSKKFEPLGANNEDFSQEIKLLQDELLDILFTQNVELIACKTNQKYDRNYQKVIRTEPTDNEDEHEIITQIIRDGFIWNENILRKQEVVLKVHKKDVNKIVIQEH